MEKVYCELLVFVLEVSYSISEQLRDYLIAYRRTQRPLFKQLLVTMLLCEF